MSPLDEHGLRELGRLAVNFGHIEFLLDHRITLLAAMKDTDMQRHLIVPLATRRKLEIIESKIDASADPKVRELVREACRIIEKANGERNDLLHGIWAFDTEDDPQGRAASRSSKKPGKKLDVEAITRIADDAARATKLLVRAMFIANGIKGEPVFPTPLWTGERTPPGWT